MIFLSVMALLMLWFMFGRIGNIWENNFSRHFDGFVVTALDGKSWVTQDKIKWDLLLRSRDFYNNGFEIKTETLSKAKVVMGDFAEVRLEEGSFFAVENVGRSVKGKLTKGRVWVSYYGDKGFPLILNNEVTEIVIKKFGSFWFEAIGPNNRISVIVGEVLIGGNLLQAQEVVEMNGVGGWQSGNGIEGQNWNDGQSWLEQNLTGGGHGGNESGGQIRGESGGQIGNGDVVQNDGIGNEQNIGNGKGGSSNDEVKVYRWGPGSVDEIVVNIPQVSSGGLIAKWFYKDALNGGPIYIEFKSVGNVGNYYFSFPIQAKPKFLGSEGVWPPGEYFVQIYYSGNLVKEQTVVRK